MAQVTLSGKLSDVTGQSIEDVSSVSVKASNAIPTSSGVTTSRPRDIEVASNGNFNITLETGVKAWVFIEGDGWSDSVPVLAASGMTDLWQAIVNALPSTMTGDLLQAIANALDTLRNAEDLVKFDHGPVASSVTSVADLEIGSHGVASTTIANNLGLPFTQGTLLISRIATGKTVIGIANSAGVQSHEMWVTSVNSGEVAPWNKVFPVVGDSIFHGIIPSNTQSVTELADGEWGLASTTVANQLGLPFTQGTLKIMPIASGKTLLGVANNAGVQKPGLWLSSISGGTVAEWVEVGSDNGTQIVSSGGGEPGLKTVGMTLTAGSALDGEPGRVRVLAQLTAPVTRWRIHIESRRQVFSTTRDFTLGNVSVGKHDGDGLLSGETSLKSGNTTIAGDREWVSRWIADDLSQETLIDITASGSSLYSYQAAAWRFDGTTWQQATEIPVAVWLEVETYQQTPVVAMIGDSTGAGQGADRPVHESALHIAGRKHRFIPMNMSYPGSTMESMTDPEHHIYKRWENLAKPDSVIVQAGSNDIHGGTSTNALRQRLDALANLALNFSPVVLGATVKARYPNSGTYHTALTTHNAYVRSQPVGIRGFLDFYQALSPNGTVAAGDAADAAHLSTAGHTKMANAFEGVPVSRPAAVDFYEVENLADRVEAAADIATINSAQTGQDREYIADQVEIMDTVFTDSIPPYLQTSSPTGLGANYQTAIVARRDTTTGEVDFAELQACADLARDTGRQLYAEGTVTTDQTLSLECSADLSGLKINYTGSGTAVRVGSVERATTRISATLPNVFSLAYDSNNSTSPWATGSIGVEVVNLRGSWITIQVVQRFHTGIYVHAVGPGPCGYNSFNLGEVWQSWVGMKLYHDTEGYTNENNFFGGRFQSPAAEGHAHIVLDGDTSLQEINSVNNNRFWGVSLEGGGGTDTSGTLVYSVDFGSAAHNIFLDCRFERSPGVRFSAKASRNRIDGGFGTFGLLDTATREEGEQFNEIDSARVKLTNQEQRFRSEYLNHDSVRIVPARSRIEFGPGTVDPGAYIAASGTRNLSIDATAIHPSSDIATNLGFPGRGWRNAYISGKINLGSLWLRDNAGVLEVGTSESGPWSPVAG